MHVVARGAFLALALLVFQVFASVASAALVQYTFTEAGGGGATGTLILDGAVSASSDWGPLNGTSLVNYFEFNSVVYVPPTSNTTTASGLLSSSLGSELDGGNITLTIPPPPPDAWALAFSPQAGADSVTIASNPAIMGDWGGGTVVPLPGAVWLFGSGLLGLLGMSGRKKTA
ncbi:MAG TPA: hypothetical protein VET88_15450 [Gammaproteobacteria bacterium]|nr:hypothetical protein [Gammaproteobacteria bacterium]